MQNKYFGLILLMVVVIFFSSCKDKEYTIPLPKTGLNNDCIKRSLGPNIVGMNIEFTYAMALPNATGKLVSSQVEATIGGAAGTYLENKSYYTNGSGVDIGIVVGNPSVTTSTKTEVTFSKDTCASTLRYFYYIPEEARGKSVSFTFSAKSSDGESVSYTMGPYVISKMDMKLDMVLSDNNNSYLSIADMAVYNSATAVANADKIDLVYLYRAITGITFLHSLVSPANTEYLPGVTLPAGVTKSTKVSKAWALRDFNLARLQYGIYIDDLDFDVINLKDAPNYAINTKAEAGVWVETADGKYRAYVYVNKVDNTAKTMTVSIKRLQVK